MGNHSNKNHRPTIRTRGGKNGWKRFFWMPVVKASGYCIMKSGAVYKMLETGWRRIAVKTE